ncbi:unnamed protein product [Closterium sp. NIES-53]
MVVTRRYGRPLTPNKFVENEGMCRHMMESEGIARDGSVVTLRASACPEEGSVKETATGAGSDERCRASLQLLALPAPCTSRPAAACELRPAALPSVRPAALQPVHRAALHLGPRAALPCSSRAAPPCPAAQRVAPCCPVQRASHCPARRALLQPTRRALLPRTSRPSAARTSRSTAACTLRSAAPRVAPYCSPRVVLCCPARRAQLPYPPRALPCSPWRALPCSAAPPSPAKPHSPARAALPNPSHAALTRSPAPPSRSAATTAAAVAAAARATAAAGGGAAGIAGGAAGAGGAGGATESAGGAAGAGVARGGQLRSLPLLDDPTPQQLCEWVIERAHPGRGGFGFLRTAQRRQQSQQETFSPQLLSELVSQRCVTGSVEAADLGASESVAALGVSVSSCFFRDCTTLTPLAAPVPASLADPTGGLVVARASTVLPCPAVPSGSLSGLHLPTFSTNLVSNAAIQDVWIDKFIPGGQCVAICQVAASSQVSASGQLAASCLCRVLSHQTLLWHNHLDHPSLPRLHIMHSHLLVSRLLRSLPPLPHSHAPLCLV